MLHVVARRSLAHRIPANGPRRLLLEGSWDDGASNDCDQLALDDLIDGRNAWIDEAAARLAEQVVDADAANASSEQRFHLANVLRLRYAFVKWLRILAFRRSTAWPFNGDVMVHLSTSPDDDEYASLWIAIAAADPIAVEVCRHDVDDVAAPATPPHNAPWRRMLGRLASITLKHATFTDEHRVLLCGNPRLLGPICDELLRRGQRVAWLFDRFAVRPWLHWRRRGVLFLHCDGPTPDFSSRDDSFVRRMNDARRSLDFDGVSLSSTLEAWTQRWMPGLGPEQARQRRAITRHAAAFRPTHIIVDEDATPLKRLLLAATQDNASPNAVSSTVVQHGACGIRFGFTPLLADRIVVGNEGSRRQLESWGLASQRIVVAGTTQQQELLSELKQAESRAEPRVKKSSGRTMLLLCTTPPRDGRPDAVTYHLTSRTYEQMLLWAFAAAADSPDATLVVKPHPRTVDDPVLRSMRQRFPNLRLRTAKSNESLAELAAAADVVLSCASSAGIDLAQAGRPVVQLLPEGSGNVLPAEWYGLVGSARSLDELRRLLRMAPPAKRIPPLVDRAAQIVEAVLDDRTAAWNETVAPPHSEREAAHV